MDAEGLRDFDVIKVPASFRSRLAILFAAVTMLVWVPVYAYLSYSYADKILADRGQALQDSAGAVGTMLGQNLRERLSDIDLMARSPLYRTAAFDDAELESALVRLQAGSHYSWIGMTDPAGTVKVATGKLLVGQDVSQRPWFAAGLGGLYVGDLHDALLLSKLLTDGSDRMLRFIDFASPVRADDGSLRGVLAAHVNWSWAHELVSLIRTQSIQEKGLEVFIVTRDGQIIYPEDERAALEVPANPSAGEVHDVRVWEHGRRYLTASYQVPEPVADAPLGWRVVVRQPIELALEDVHRLQNLLVIFVIGSALIFLLLTWWSASYISRPIERLVRLAHRIEREEALPAIKLDRGPLEVRQLSAALGKMAQTLISQRDELLLSNHELESEVQRRTQDLARANSELLKLARHDALTGLANRRAVDERLQEEFVRCKRSHEPFVVVIADIDFFKRINDTYGHGVGDEVLRQVAALLGARLRESDLVGRMGGEEFIMILPATSAEDGARLADAVRVLIESTPFPVVGAVTASFGVAQADEDLESVAAVMERADRMLYAAKAAGRNRVEVHA